LDTDLALHRLNCSKKVCYEINDTVVVAIVMMVIIVITLS
jgi:hypothetical protein